MIPDIHFCTHVGLSGILLYVATGIDWSTDVDFHCTFTKWYWNQIVFITWAKYNRWTAVRYFNVWFFYISLRKWLKEEMYECWNWTNMQIETSSRLQNSILTRCSTNRTTTLSVFADTVFLIEQYKATRMNKAH